MRIHKSHAHLLVTLKILGRGDEAASVSGGMKNNDGKNFLFLPKAMEQPPRESRDE